MIRTYYEEPYLEHHGVIGMKWGHSKGPSQIIKSSKSANLDKWGKTKDQNCLYITGVSGSGKSTLARKIANKNTNLIGLDPYFQKISKNIPAGKMDKDFTAYLSKNFPEYKSIASAKGSEIRSKSWWKKVDTLMNQTENFAKAQFPKKKVIIEGIQLSDQTVYPNKDFFKGKPIIITEGGAIKSYIRGHKRDGIKLVGSIDSGKKYIQGYLSMTKGTKTLVNKTSAKKGKRLADDLMSLNGTVNNYD